MCTVTHSRTFPKAVEWGLLILCQQVNTDWMQQCSWRGHSLVTSCQDTAETLHTSGSPSQTGVGVPLGAVCATAPSCGHDEN